ncbi:MAG: bifunctional diaminohydroxyphosphoribosylaminopyrimidine deaminase/5-amino-6-(5-phosphoribosylamino)uracil reductase RibD [Bdellovibrionota bacterium]|nr:bifunctional diaminohydroxyphosphoribosylaminopyrimidine deaminase/5-amino-6-(5-phosphoribosylamino)uracil reductase RibD [Bdellovibrionota bacterium]
MISKARLGEKYSDDQAMKLAIDIAYQGWGDVKSNPMVGCVVLSSEQNLVSFGYHEKYGEGHAEVNALKNVEASQVEGGSIFVTLEPCSHYGKTPPCAELVRQFPFARLVIGLMDPNPLVNGKGAMLVAEKGILVETHTKYLNELEQQNSIFLTNMKEKRPFWAVKQGLSKDYKITGPEGKTARVTNEESRKEVYRLRHGYSCISVSGRTLLQDSPKLSVIHNKQEYYPDLLVFCTDPQKYLSLKVPALNQRTAEQVAFLVPGEEFKIGNIQAHEIIEVNWESEESVLKMQNHLYKNRKYSSIFIEPGAELFDFLWQRKIIDRYYFFVGQETQGDAAKAFSKVLEFEKDILCNSLTAKNEFSGDQFFEIKV